MSTEQFSLAMNEISDRYIEEALTYQAPAIRPRVRPLVRIALAACLAAIMLLGTAMAVSAEFREVMVGWFREQYETFMHYEYRDEDRSTASDSEGSAVFVPHRLTELPPGYTEASSICDGESGQQLTIYRNEADGKACLVSVGIGGNAYVEAAGHTIRPVEVAGTAGELYLPDDPTKSSSIVWTKENMFFCISGCFTPEELVYYAACLQPAPAQEAEPSSEAEEAPCLPSTAKSDFSPHTK